MDEKIALRGLPSTVMGLEESARKKPEVSRFLTLAAPPNHPEIAKVGEPVGCRPNLSIGGSPVPRQLVTVSPVKPDS
jgi:hypothetical protein